MKSVMVSIPAEHEDRHKISSSFEADSAHGGKQGHMEISLTNKALLLTVPQRRCSDSIRNKSKERLLHLEDY